MLPEDRTIHLTTLILAADKIGRYTAGLGFERFLGAPMVIDAVLFNLRLLTAAARQIPPTIHAAYPDVSWQALADFREADIENYATVDLEAVWAMVQDGLPSTVRLREIRELERAAEND